MEEKIFKRLMYIGAILIITAVTIASCGAKKTDKHEAVEACESVIEYAGVEEYTVKGFDTLSGIAVKYIPSDKYMDKWIHDVKRLNGRSSSTIYSGEVIKVYVYEQ